MEIAECYTYACNTPKFKRKNKPASWIKVQKINGQMFSSYPVFEFIPGTKDNEPLRFGDFVIDIDSEDIACQDAIKIIEWFDSNYGLDNECWRIYLSGKKGVHLELPAETCGTTSGHHLLTMGYKRLAKDIEAEIGAMLDLSMYNKGTGKPFRRPNVMRDETGTCKRQIEYDTLFEITDNEDYIAVCKEPGKIWDAKKSKSPELINRIKYYIKEAEKADLNKPESLTESQQSALNSSLPPCIKFLRNNTLPPAKGGATFNDIAIQLTAYCISAGISEQRFLSGCDVFISQYPSSSLNTKDKRLSNCRDRYRTMSVNDYQHSCGGIMSLGFSPFEFECHGCSVKKIQHTDGLHIVNSVDVEHKNDSLVIPDSLLKCGGGFELGINSVSSNKIIQFNFPLVTGIIGNAIAKKIKFNNIYANTYNIRVGSTSTGKSESDKDFFTAMINRAKLKKDFNYMTDFSSGASLYANLQHTPQTILFLDEATKLFRKFSRPDPSVSDKIDALLDIYSKSGMMIRKIYTSKKNNIEVDNPCMSILGNATPIIFDEIREEDFLSGLIQRFDFWYFDGKIPYREIKSKQNNNLDDFFNFLESLIAESSGSELLDTLGASVDIGGTIEFYKDLSILSHNIIDRANAEDNEGIKGMISRKYDLGIKYALIHHASDAYTDPATLFHPLDVEDLTWGVEVAEMIVNWKINTLYNRTVTGQFDYDCEYFKRAIMKATKCNIKTSFSVMANRNKKMKNWSKIYSASIIEMLETRKEIVVDESSKTTTYFLVSNKNS